MTKFMSYFNLSRINDSKDLLGISPDCVKGNLIVTLSRNIIIVVKISSQQQIISWSTQEKLSNKVIYDKISKKYVGVFGNRFIRCWDASDSDINGIKKHKLQKSVLDIVTCEDLCIILYKDGSLDQLSDVLLIRKRLSMKSNFLSNPQLKYNNVRNVAVKYLNGVKVLTYFEKDEYSKDIDLVMMPLKTGAKERRLKIWRKDLNLSGYAVVEGDTSFMLFTIWSDHKLFLLNLDEEIESENVPGNFISTISILKVDAPLTIVAVGKNCVAIYGANSSQEGASLLLYNTQFKVVKAQQYFKVYFDYSRIWINEDNIVLAIGQNLSVVSFRMSHDLLVDLLGTYNTKNRITIEGDFINEEVQMQSFCELKEIVLKGSDSSVETNKSNKHCIVYTTPGEKFCKLTHLAEMNEKFVNVDQERSLIDDVVNIVKTHSEKHLPSKTLIEFYIHQLDNCGATEQEISETLLALGNKIKNYSNIINVVGQFLCASELVIAKVFFCMVIKSSSNPLSKIVRSSTDILVPLFINTGFQPIRKSSFIQNYRKDATSFYLLYILDYLYRLLTDPSHFKSVCFETCTLKIEMQILYWFDFLLSAHFQHLVLSRELEVLNVLLRWTKLIIDYKNQTEKLQEVLRLLYNVIQQEGYMQKSNTYMWYCIEDLSF